MSPAPNFVFSAVLSGHSADVRCLATLKKSEAQAALLSMVSGSRDLKAKVWRTTPQSKDREWAEDRVFEAHERYVTALATAAPSDAFPEGLVYTGTVGGVIRVFSPAASAPLHVEEGAHASTVASLFVSPATGTLVSGSWDCTAKVWVGDKMRRVMTLQGHENSVWAVGILPETGVMITASADTSIRLWQAGACKSDMKKVHEQAIRDVNILGSHSFMTVANDGIAKLWKLKMEPQVSAEAVRTIAVHDHFVYSMTQLSIQGEGPSFAVGGENSGVKVFRDGQQAQVLNVPAISVWNVKVLSNGDLAAGCSDGKIWIFTQSEDRKADSDLAALYESELAKFQRPAQTELQGIKTEDLPGPSALLAPGKRDGQTKMVIDGGKISVHSWSESEQKWTKVGDVVGQPGGGEGTPAGAAPGGGKVTYEGKEYDFVFDIELDDTGGKLKLPFNRGEDAWMAAQNFINKHELPQGYLDTIANFVTKNSGGAAVASSAGQAVDPFTGGGAYTSGSGGVGSSGGGGAVDPFTGGGAYTTNGGGGQNGHNDPQPMDVDNSYFPHREYLCFQQVPKMEAMTAKLRQFNEQVPGDVKLSDAQMDSLKKLCDKDGQCTADDVRSLLRCLSWPFEQVFPALDVLRLAVRNTKAADVLLENKDDLLSLLLQNLSAKAPATCQMLALKTLVNLFGAGDAAVDLLRKQREAIVTRAVATVPSANKALQVALCTLVLNFSVLSGRDKDKEAQAQLLTCLCMLLLEATTDPEARFRALVALGNLLNGATPNNAKLAKDMSPQAALELWVSEADGLMATDAANSRKIKECARFVLAELKKL